MSPPEQPLLISLIRELGLPCMIHDTLSRTAGPVGQLVGFPYAILVETAPINWGWEFVCDRDCGVKGRMRGWGQRLAHVQIEHSLLEAEAGAEVRGEMLHVYLPHVRYTYLNG